MASSLSISRASAVMGTILERSIDIPRDISFKGEFTLIAGKENQATTSVINSVIEAQTSKLLKKFTLTETVEIVHKLTNISKKDIYKMALSINHD